MMKRTILLLFAALCGALTAAAQDLIVKTDATKIEAKVIEITPEAVRYKRFSNPDGPTYVLPVKEIHYIQYANGEKEYYTRTIPATPLTPATPAQSAPAETPAAGPATQTPAGRYVLKQYEIGELYDQNGIRGVICQRSTRSTSIGASSANPTCVWSAPTAGPTERRTWRKWRSTSPPTTLRGMISRLSSGAGTRARGGTCPPSTRC